MKNELLKGALDLQLNSNGRNFILLDYNKYVSKRRTSAQMVAVSITVNDVTW